MDKHTIQQAEQSIPPTPPIKAGASSARKKERPFVPLRRRPTYRFDIEPTPNGLLLKAPPDLYDDLVSILRGLLSTARELRKKSDSRDLAELKANQKLMEEQGKLFFAECSKVLDLFNYVRNKEKGFKARNAAYRETGRMWGCSANDVIGMMATAHHRNRRAKATVKGGKRG